MLLTPFDVSAFEANHRRGGVGVAGYDPRMLLALLVYAYCRGVRSSGQIERLCHTDIAFKVLCAGGISDHAIVARLRAGSEEIFAGLFTQVLMIAARAGLARFGTIVIDGTKIPANASIDANRGQDWFDQQGARIAADIVDEAGSVDAAENTRAARQSRDDRVRDSSIDRSHRPGRIRCAAGVLTEQQQRLRTDEDAQHTLGPRASSAITSSSPSARADSGGAIAAG